MGCNADVEFARYDIREVERTSVPFGRGGGFFFDCYFQSDGTRMLSFTGDVAYGYHFPQGEAFAGNSGYGGEVTGKLRFHPRVQTELSVGLDYTPHGPRYTTTIKPQLYQFGNLNSHYFSLTVRQQFVITPRLTLQGYAQLFTDSQYTLAFFDASSSGRAIKSGDLRPVVAAEQVERSSALNFNVVLRWEYRLGSTLYAVYARSQQGAPTQTVKGFEALAPDKLFSGPATDSILIKWSYWWG